MGHYFLDTVYLLLLSVSFLRRSFSKHYLNFIRDNSGIKNLTTITIIILFKHKNSNQDS